MFFRRGFSLLEVGVALLILGLAVTAIFQFISSTTISTFNLEDRAYARQIGNNRLALVQTLEPMTNLNEANGRIDFGGKTFLWSQTISPASNNLSEIIIRVSNEKKLVLYELKVLIEKK